MSDKAFCTSLLHILNLGRLTHVLLIRNNLHDTGQNGFVAVRMLLTNLTKPFTLLLMRLTNAWDLVHSLVPLLFRSEN